LDGHFALSAYGTWQTWALALPISAWAVTDHRRFTVAIKIDVYFCDLQSPWRR